MKKWTVIVLVVLVCTLIAGLFCLSSAAATAEKVLVNGVDLVTDADHTVSCGSGTAVYDTATRTLTLTDSEITVAASFRSGKDAAGIYFDGQTQPVTVVLNGKNTIVLTDTSKNNSGIWSDARTDLSIRGTGSLDIKLYGSYPYAVRPMYGSLTVQDVAVNCTLAEGLSDVGSVVEPGSYDSISSGPYNISLENATVTASGYGLGIFAFDALSVKNSTVCISSADAALYTGGVSDFLIENSTVTASASWEDCSAICSWQNLIIKNSSVTATAKGNAIYSYGEVTVSDGSKLNLTSTDSDCFSTSHGITVSGGSSLTAKGLYVGIYTGEIFSVTDGYVSAEGGIYGICARRVLSGDASVKPAESAVAVSLSSNCVPKEGLTLYTKDWAYTEVWDSWEWDYFDRWQSVSYYKDGDGAIAKSVVIDLKPADYTAVNAALAAVEKLDKTSYKDFSAVDAAVKAVVTGKKITEQAEVDAMAKAINDAVAALKLKDADYTAVNAALAAVEKLDKTSYKDFSAVDAAVKAVVTGKKITEQAEVDAMAKVINDAIAGLVVNNPKTSDSLVNLWLLPLMIVSIAGFFVIRKRNI